MTKGYDPACLTLAEYFLGGVSDRLKAELAQAIQDTVEDWIEAERDRLRVAIGVGESEKPQ